jgi:rhodanese-related sulfurtransferase
MARLVEFVGNHPFLFLALGGIIAILVATEVRRRLSGVRSVGPVEAVNLINHEDALLLDIREDGEYKGGHITNAKHIPMSVLGSRLKELEKHRGKPIIAYCRSGSRSMGACNLLRKSGYENVFNLGGGILAWQNASLPVSRK